MPSLSDFGLAPEEPERREPQRRRYGISDESGARPLPAEAYDPSLDEEVDIPVSGPPAGLYFGIGVGLGLAVLAIVVGLYFRGAIGAPTLGETPANALSGATQEARFQEWTDFHALQLARLAEVRLTGAQTFPPGTQVESRDIKVIEEPLSAPHPTPPPANEESSGTPSSGTNQLSNELDELEQSLRPRGPTAPPRAPSNDQAAPEAPLPPPAEPTAPAEMSPPTEPPANP
jgi:hypothetical protein